MPNPQAPREGNDTTGAKLGYGMHDSGAGEEAALPRIVRAVLVDDESTPSGAVAVADLEEPLSAVIDVASDDSPATIVAAPGSGLRIRVWQYTVVAEGDVDLVWGSASTPLSGPMHFTADGEGAAPSAGGLVPLFTCEVDEALTLTLSADVQVSGHLSYTVVPA